MENFLLLLCRIIQNILDELNLVIFILLDS